MKRIIPLAIFVLTIQLNSFSQAPSEKWQTCNALDKSFSVEIPIEAKAKKEDEKTVSCYYNLDNFRFSVNKSDFSLFKEQLSSLSKDQAIYYLAVLSIGIDNNPSEMTEKSINLNGIKGKEYLSQGKKRRGQFFLLGNDLFAVIFYGQNANDLQSPIANHFFDSFRIKKLSKNKNE